ncbi:hypothetical protein CC86DRAFT_403024 [Ophiobolus disseminans]|uniref:Uncharacterized protein n=1 Tax=Ophiobolus disseminans TaxID=1469910 RepID=A0A6A7AAA5_9PLEO|nr:hypothetical protein CC86DRAFT_403024 [Ophiobolus disseminans]
MATKDHRQSAFPIRLHLPFTPTPNPSILYAFAATLLTFVHAISCNTLCSNNQQAMVASRLTFSSISLSRAADGIHPFPCTRPREPVHISVIKLNNGKKGYTVLHPSKPSQALGKHKDETWEDDASPSTHLHDPMEMLRPEHDDVSYIQGLYSDPSEVELLLTLSDFLPENPTSPIQGTHRLESDLLAPICAHEDGLADDEHQVQEGNRPLSRPTSTPGQVYDVVDPVIVPPYDLNEDSHRAFSLHMAHPWFNQSNQTAISMNYLRTRRSRELSDQLLPPSRQLSPQNERPTHQQIRQVVAAGSSSENESVAAPKSCIPGARTAFKEDGSRKPGGELFEEISMVHVLLEVTDNGLVHHTLDAMPDELVASMTELLKNHIVDVDQRRRT